MGGGLAPPPPPTPSPRSVGFASLAISSNIEILILWHSFEIPYIIATVPSTYNATRLHYNNNSSNMAKLCKIVLLRFFNNEAWL